MVWAGLPACLMSYLPGADSVLCKQLRSGAECCAAEARITNERLRTAAGFVSSAMQALAGKSFSHVASLRVCHPLQAARVLILARLPTAGATPHGRVWRSSLSLVCRVMHAVDGSLFVTR